MWHKCFEMKCLHGTSYSKVPVDFFNILTTMSSSGRKKKWHSNVLAHTLIKNSHTTLTWTSNLLCSRKKQYKTSKVHAHARHIISAQQTGLMNRRICFSVTVGALVLITNARRYKIVAKASSKLLPQLWFIFSVFFSVFFSSFFMLQG